MTRSGVGSDGVGSVERRYIYIYDSEIGLNLVPCYQSTETTFPYAKSTKVLLIRTVAPKGFPQRTKTQERYANSRGDGYIVGCGVESPEIAPPVGNSTPAMANSVARDASQISREKRQSRTISLTVSRSTATQREYLLRTIPA